MAISEPLPDFLTVEEAAAVLRIGRTAAYGLARQWRATDGAEGLPVVSFGRLLRVPRAALETFAGGPLSSPTETVGDQESEPQQPADPTNPTYPAEAPRPTTSTPRRTTRPTDQPSLFGQS